jgi:FkbM family methyltransferase
MSAQISEIGLAREINSDLQIHCFEPSPPTFKQLRERNFPGKIVYNNFGLSSARGEAKLQVFAEGMGNNSLYKRQGLEDGWGLAEQSREEAVHLETLDAYCQRSGIHNIDLMKVDVEGHELEVFRGGTEMFKDRKIKRIQFEYGGCNIDSRVLLKDIFNFFSPYGYSFYKVFPTALRLVLRYDQRLENFQHQNWIAISPDLKGEPL